jgi:type I restriction enzyme S subunit
MSKVKYINTPIKKIGRVITGKTPSTQCREYYGDGYMFITPVELHDGYNIQTSEKHITDLGLESIKTNSLEGTSVLVGCIGWDMGNVAICCEKCATNQQINSITDFKSEYNPYYIYYWLLRKKDYLFSIASVTRTPILSKSLFEEVIIPVPSRPIQDDIVNVLKSIDSKIEINKRICSELESMAKTLYDYWFLQFDFPDGNGRPYRTSGGEMVWNEQLKREIPKGWAVGKIGQLGSIVSGGTPTTTCADYYCDNGFAWITPNDLSGNGEKMFVSHGERDITQAGIDGSSAVLMPKHSVLLSTRAPIGYLAISDNEVSTNQGFKSIIPNAGYHEYYIYYLLKRNIPAISQQGVGTTFKEVSKETLSDFKLPLPPKPIANEFANAVSSLCENRCVLEKENEELTKLRDWLLPMLMNGQARVE